MLAWSLRDGRGFSSARPLESERHSWRRRCAMMGRSCPGAPACGSAHPPPRKRMLRKGAKHYRIRIDRLLVRECQENQHAHATRACSHAALVFPSYVRTAEQVQSPTTQTDAVTMDAQLLPPSAIAERVMWLPRDAIFSPAEQPLVLRRRTRAPRRYELSPALLARGAALGKAVRRLHREVGRPSAAHRLPSLLCGPTSNARPPPQAGQLAEPTRGVVEGAAKARARAAPAGGGCRAEAA